MGFLGQGGLPKTTRQHPSSEMFSGLTLGSAFSMYSQESVAGNVCCFDDTRRALLIAYATLTWPDILSKANE